jgi:hypothetical protein
MYISDTAAEGQVTAFAVKPTYVKQNKRKMPNLTPSNQELTNTSQANVFLSRDQRREALKTGKAEVKITRTMLQTVGNGYLVKPGAIFDLYDQFLTALNIPGDAVIMHHRSGKLGETGETWGTYRVPLIFQKEGRLVLVFGSEVLPMTLETTPQNTVLLHVDGTDVTLTLRAVMEPAKNGGGNNLKDVKASWVRQEQDPVTMMMNSIDTFIPFAMENRPDWQDPAKLSVFNQGLYKSLYQGIVSASISEVKAPRGENMRVLEPGLYRTIAAELGPIASGKQTVNGSVTLVAPWTTFNTPVFGETFDANFDADPLTVDLTRYFKTSAAIEEFEMGMRTCWFVVFPLTGMYNEHVTVLVSPCVDCVDETAEFWADHLYTLIGDTLQVNSQQKSPSATLRPGYMFDPFSDQRQDILAAPAMAAVPGLNPAAMAALPATPAAQSVALPFDFDAPAVTVAAAVVPAPPVAAPVAPAAAASNVVAPTRRRAAAPATVQAAAPAAVAANADLATDF